MNKYIIEPFLSRYRWAVLAAVWLAYAVFGLNMRAIAPMVTPILSDLKMSYGEMGFILGSWQLVYIPAALVAGIVLDRWGIRRSLLAGIAILAVSAGLRYFAAGFGSLLPAVALFGIGGPLISIGAPKTIAVWFRGRDRAMAVGIYTTAPWLGGLFAVAATNSLVMPLTGYSWKVTFVAYSLFTLAAALVWWLFARDAGQPAGAVQAGIKETFLRLARLHNIRIVLFAGLLTLMIDHGFSHWLPRMLETRSYSPETAGFMASIPLFAAIPSVLVLPGLVPRRLRGRALAVIGLATSAALLTVHFASSWLLVTGLVLYGIAAPVMLPLLMLMLMDDPQVGPEVMGLAGGVFFCIAEIGGFTGPLLMGGLADLTGTFLSGMALLAGTGIVLCVTMFFLKDTGAD